MNLTYAALTRAAEADRKSKGRVAAAQPLRAGQKEAAKVGGR